MNTQLQQLYDDNWLNNVKSKNISSSWAEDVLRDIDGYGGIYLYKIREWFLKFPCSTKQSKHMKKCLESVVTEDHLGAVNELFCYNLARFFKWSLEVLTEKRSAPDFRVISPSCFYCEITTLNISQSDSNSFAKGKSVPITNHDKEASRILRKVAEEDKISQLKYGYDKQKPSVLIVFDYTMSSGFGTQRSRAFADTLLDTSAMPKELSTLVYLERYISKGKFKLRLSQSAAYHNPSAGYPLEKTVFSRVKQFPLEYSEISPQLSTDLLIE